MLFKVELDVLSEKKKVNGPRLRRLAQLRGPNMQAKFNVTQDALNPSARNETAARHCGPVGASPVVPLLFFFSANSTV